MSTGGSSGGVKSDINVTPLVDVVLVLLIIFLVTMPIIMKDVPLEIPRKLEDTAPVIVENQVVVEAFVDGRILVSGVEVTKFQLADKVAEALKPMREKTVFVGFADELKYGEAVSIIDAVRGGGAEKVALKMREDKAPTPEGGQTP
jgi:biopolymer transport protein ExbD